MLEPADYRSPMRTCLLTIAMTLLSASSSAQSLPDSLIAPYTAEQCPRCATWNTPHPPFRIFGNSWYVGTHGLGALLITSPEGHVLIDGGLPDTAPLILASITALGFDIRDVRLILNSHPHYDHAGGIAALQHASGARVAASVPSARVLATGKADASDPQYGLAYDIPAVTYSRLIEDGKPTAIGPLRLTPHVTGGHTPGGTTWTWQSCEGERCLDLVYADSQTPVSADGFRFSDGATYPNAVADFRGAHALLETMACDILITPHPEASQLWERVASGTLVDPEACARYAANARRNLERRLERETATLGVPTGERPR